MIHSILPGSVGVCAGLVFLPGDGHYKCVCAVYVYVFVRVFVCLFVLSCKYIDTLTEFVCLCVLAP